MVGLDGEGHVIIVGQIGESHDVGTGLSIEHLLIERTVGIIADVQAQPLHHVEHHRGGLQGLHLVVDIGTGLEKIEISQHARRVTHGIALGIFLDEKRSRTGVDGRSGQEIEYRHAEGDRQRDDKPIPLAKAQIEKVLETQEIVGLLRFICRSVLYSHVITNV